MKSNDSLATRDLLCTCSLVMLDGTRYCSSSRCSHSGESCNVSHYGSRSGLIMPSWRVERILWRSEWDGALLLVNSIMRSKKMVRIHLCIWIWNTVRTSLILAGEETNTNSCDTNWWRQMEERYAGKFECPNTPPKRNWIGLLTIIEL